MSNAEALITRRPHNVSPDLASVRVILVSKNFSAVPGVCHTGLRVTTINNMKVLRRHGVHVEAWAAQTAKELSSLLSKHINDSRPITHVIVSATSWIQPTDFASLISSYPEIEFVMLNHTGTACLTMDKFGIRNIRAGVDIELGSHNFRVGFNNPRGSTWTSQSFGFQALLLPNLYDTESFVNPIVRRRVHDPLRIGSFGATRPWKNQLTAAEASVQLARRLGVNLELYINVGRPDGGEREIEARAELFEDLPGCKLVKVPWARWPRFRDIVATMDLLFSPSFDETFCVVCADGIAEGVPSVVTGAMEWTPKQWWCDPWDPSSVVATAMGLLHDPNTIHDARVKLTEFVNVGVARWINFLTKGAAR